MSILNITERLMRNRHNCAAKKYLSQIKDYSEQYKRKVNYILDHFNKIPEQKILLGKTEWGKNISIPEKDLLKTHGLITGATGGGKSYAVLNILLQILNNNTNYGFGICDQKGELFQKSLQLIAAFLVQADPVTKQNIENRLHVFDFADNQSITPYNILTLKDNEKLEYLVLSRLDSICEQFTGSSSFTTKMRQILKYFLLLLAEQNLPLTFFENLCDNEDLLFRVAQSSQNERVKNYFLSRFRTESKTTLPALRQRIDAILTSESIRLSLSAGESPDFRKLMDEKTIILINTAGLNISKSTSLLIQMFILSDIRQAIFRRKNIHKPFVWFMDEAQLLFRHSSSRENIADLLCLARSYGTFTWLITQSLFSAVSDSEIRNAISCNVRNILMLRSTLEDAKILVPAIPITGTQAALKKHPLQAVRIQNPREELRSRLEEVTRFPDRVGYLWMKTVFDKAIKIKTSYVPEPEKIAGKEGSSWREFYLRIKKSKGVSANQILKQLKEKEKWLKNLFTTKTHHVASIVKDVKRIDKDNGEVTSMLKILEKEYQLKNKDEQ